MSDKKKVVTGINTRWSYVNVLEPKSMNGGPAKYSVSLIIPKSDKETVEKIEIAMKAAYEDGLAKLKGTSRNVTTFESLKKPLRDGDIERPGDPEYVGCYFINANNKSKPGVVDTNLAPIIDPSEIYSGVYGRASISFYAFNSNGNKGIACSLNNLQKIRDGEPLSGHSRPEEDFKTETLPDFLK